MGFFFFFFLLFSFFFLFLLSSSSSSSSSFFFFFSLIFSFIFSFSFFFFFFFFVLLFSSSLNFLVISNLFSIASLTASSSNFDSVAILPVDIPGITTLLPVINVKGLYPLTITLVLCVQQALLTAISSEAPSSNNFLTILSAL